MESSAAKDGMRKYPTLFGKARMGSLRYGGGKSVETTKRMDHNRPDVIAIEKVDTSALLCYMVQNCLSLKRMRK